MVFSHNFVDPPKMKRITNDDGKRIYVTPSGNKYESVTTYLGRCFAKPHIAKWKKRLGTVESNKIASAARARGTSLHTAVENYLLNDPMDLNDQPNIKSLFLRVRPLFDRCNNLRLMEKALYSDSLQLAGTPDLIGDFDSELSVIDLKSNNFVRTSKLQLVDYLLQCAMYGVMFNELYDAMPQKVVVIVAAPKESQGILWTHPMDDCLRLLDRFRTDPERFAALLAARVAAMGKTALRASESVPEASKIPESNQQLTVSA